MTAPKVGFVSLGCPKALVDSERILTQLRIDGYEVVGNYSEAGVVVVNTCGFIDAAKQESLEAIGEALAENGRVIVTGCMGQDPSEIERVHPQVLAVTGPQAYEAVVGSVHEHLPIDTTHDPFTNLVPPQGIKLTPRHYAYLKISEGCNHRCRFCIIPSLRGDLASRPIGEVLQEAEGLVEAGVQELLVISQDTSAYGLDLKYRTGFWRGRPLKTRMLELCQALGELGVWVRLHYVYPYPHVDAVIPLMESGHVLPYLDIPFQHGSPSVLKRMRRPAAAENTLDRIRAWRDICPDLTLRSTFIVGYPGETEAEFQDLLDFLSEAQIDRVGCFQYSPVEGAAANALPNPVDEATKQDRFERLMAHQAEISTARLARKVGTVQQVIVDGIEDGVALGRSRGDAPEIDGLVYVNLPPGHQFAPGERIMVRVTTADAYDLHGELATQAAPA
ncbi:MAG: 30S ribosomal protein S12 methylthiotransferase RimO [Pseudomonadota bacterium]|nr:30S ribosomal protein S12 methylthiotransferase RimO [Pseudomonadota bacterium]